MRGCKICFKRINPSGYFLIPRDICDDCKKSLITEARVKDFDDIIEGARKMTLNRCEICYRTDKALSFQYNQLGFNSIDPTKRRDALRLTSWKTPERIKYLFSFLITQCSLVCSKCSSQKVTFPNASATLAVFGFEYVIEQIELRRFEYFNSKGCAACGVSYSFIPSSIYDEPITIPLARLNKIDEGIGFLPIVYPNKQEAEHFICICQHCLKYDCDLLENRLVTPTDELIDSSLIAAKVDEKCAVCVRRCTINLHQSLRTRFNNDKNILIRQFRTTTIFDVINKYQRVLFD